MGWERKRGKLEELNRLLIGRQIAADPGLAAEFEGADLRRAPCSTSGAPPRSTRCASSSPWTRTRSCPTAPPGA